MPNIVKPINTLSILSLIQNRLLNEWKLMLAIFAGVLVAAILISGAPIYLKSLERISVNAAFDQTSNVTLNALVYTPNIVLSQNSLEESQKIIDLVVNEQISDVYVDERRLIRSPNYLAGLPYRALETRMVSRGYVQYMENIEQNIVFLDGRMATNSVIEGPRGPVIEVILGKPSLDIYDLNIGDIVELTTFIDNEIRISAKITGIFEPVDSKAAFWRENSATFLKPAPLEESVQKGVTVDPDEPPLPFFSTQKTLTQGISKAYPGTIVSSSWLIFLDRENLKQYDVAEAKSRFANFRKDIALSLPGSFVLSIVPKVLETYEKRSLYTSIPLLLLLTLMVVTVLYYMSMMVSYLVKSREEDVIRLRTRGISVLKLFQVYVIEISVLTILAVAVAPFISMGLIAIAGKLPYFKAITFGDLIPVDMSWEPFVAAAALGVLCLLIYTVAGLIAARSGVISYRLRLSRPLLSPFFQKYYIDIGFLIIGGIVFWELQTRGSFLSGDMSNNAQLNEGLLFAPVLFLIGVALIFMRLFPLVVRYVAGESVSLVNLITVFTLIMIGPVYAFQSFIGENNFNWIVQLLIAGGLLVTYRWIEPKLLTGLNKSALSLFVGLIIQIGLICVYFYLSASTSHLLFNTVISLLISLVPLQILFIVLRYFSNRWPIWISMSLWHMARNPFQYSWLVLLLVLITGMAVLSTTVGGTLDRSQVERVLHQTGAEIRVTGLPSDKSKGIDETKKFYRNIDGVSELALAFRGVATIGLTGAGYQFDVLGIQPGEFNKIAWFRDDYADTTLNNLMTDLQNEANIEQLILPVDATEIGIYVKPAEVYPNIFVWLVVEDNRGIVRTVSLGRTAEAQWQSLKATIPDSLIGPIKLLSVQIYEPVLGPNGSIGSMQFDDIFVTTDSTVDSRDKGNKIVVEDFEDKLSWRTLVSSPLATHQLSTTNLDANSGQRSAQFDFGKDTSEGIRGFYFAPSGGLVPVIINESLSLSTGIEVSDNVLVSINGQVIPITVTKIINNFPTLRSDRGFIVSDLDLLLRTLKLKGVNVYHSPNELFILTDDGSNELVVDMIYDELGRAAPVRVYDRDTSLASAALDPLVAGGWKAMVIISVAVVIFTGALGYSAHLLSFSERTSVQMATLSTLGLSRLQVAGLLYLENAVIFVMGIGLGTWAGFQMSELMVDSVAVTETGFKVMPVFQVITNWQIMWPVYGILCAIFFVAVGFMYRTVIKVDLAAISRRSIN